MKYNCPICETEMRESNFYNLRSCRECHLSIEVKVLDTIAVSTTYIVKLEQREEQLVNGWSAAEDRYEARIAELEKECDAKDAHIAELKARIDSFTHEISGGGWLCDQ